MKHYATYLALRVLVFALRFMPWPLIHAVSDIASFLVQHVVGYRRSVVRSNLRRAFPDKDGAWHRRAMRASYTNLTDIILEQLKSATMSDEALFKRISGSIDIDFHSMCEQGKAPVVLMAHTANWEWASRALPWLTGRAGIVAYKSQKNPFVDEYLQQKRSMNRMLLTPMQGVVRRFLKEQDKWRYIILLSDQNPVRLDKAHYVTFFGESVPFIPGAGTISHRYEFPVYYFSTERSGRSRYRYHIGLLTDRASELVPKDITQMYAARLESVIRNSPSDWLWSHRRWRHVGSASGN